MDPRPDKSRKSKEDRRLMIKKHFVDKQKKKQSSSKGDSKKLKTNEDASPSTMKSEDDSVKRSDSPSRSSPEPNCAICLEPLTNKSFTDSCFHTFCFTCLVEWSKVKPECPLCKQQFKSIVHNVQNDFSYDEYHINTKTTNIWAFCAGEQPRFRYATTMTPLNYVRRNIETYQENFNSQIESHRMRYAPHTVRMYSNSNVMSRAPCHFRNRVYSQGLWVRPVVGDRVRVVSAEFYRRNPACTHRLLPWLNRELVALLQNNETQVTFVLELIMALIARYEITSQEFLVHIEPYLADKTRHFIHELHNFAISPHDMDTYDRLSIYSGPTDSHHMDQEPETDISILGQVCWTPGLMPIFPRSNEQNNPQATKIVLKKTADNNWETVIPPGSQNLSNPGPSTSNSARNSERLSPPLRFVSTLDDSDDEECQVVDVLKPKAERTPEIVDLSSDDEATQTVIDVTSDSDNSTLINSPISTPRFEFSPWRMMMPLKRLQPPCDLASLACRLTLPSPPSSVSWSTKYPPSPDEYRTPSFIDSDSSDIECVFSSEQALPSTSRASHVETDRKQDPSTEVSEGTSEKDSSSATITMENEAEQNIPASSKPELKEEDIATSSKPEPKKEDVQASSKPEPKKKLSSAIVRPWAMQVQAPKESVPKPSKSKRRASSSHSNDLSSSYSDNTTSDDRSSGPKKLKLRSVVAHFSFDASEKRHESSHRPSHKKHKDKKKKKKKKHVHKHKHRVYSDSDSS